MVNKAKIEKYAPYGVWIFFVFVCFYYSIEILNGGNSWKTGDWLINYSAGFVRRGLIGSFLLLVSDFGFPLLWLTYATQIAIYASIFVIVLKLYQRVTRSLFWTLILYSPAFLLFPFYDIQGGFRKEILVFAVFAYYCLLYANRNTSPLKLALIFAAYIIAAFSHELTVFTLPFFLYLTFVSAKESLITRRTAIIYSAILVTSSVLILFLVYFNKGNDTQAQTICMSLLSRGLQTNICEGAISWLNKDTDYAINSVLNNLGYWSVSTPVLLWLALLPLKFTTWWNKERTFLLIASLVAIFPLFLVATDWGRWVYIVSFMFFCLALASDVSIKYNYRSIFVVAGLIYLTSWSIPHCCVGGVNFGILGYVGKAIIHPSWILEKVGAL